MRVSKLLSVVSNRGSSRAEALQSLRDLLFTSLHVNAFLLSANTGLNALASLVFWTVVTRFYRPQDVGLAAATLSALSLLAMLSQLGLGSSLIRFLPEKGKQASWLINAAFTFCMFASFLTAGAFLAGLQWWSPKLLFLHQTPYLLFFVLFAVALTLINLMSMVLVAQRAAKFILVSSAVSNLLRFSLPVAFAPFLASFGIVSAFGLSLLGGLAIAGYALHHLRSDWKPRLNLNLGVIVKMIPFAISNHLSDLLLSAPTPLLSLIVVNLLGPKAGAFFYIPWLMGLLIHSVSSNLSLSLFAEGSHRPGRLLPLVRSALFLALGSSIAGAVLLFLAGDKFLLLFGRDYSQEGVGLLRLVGLAAIPASLTYLFLGVKRIRKEISGLLAISGIVALVTLVVSYALLPQLGLEGAGVGLLTGQGLGAIILVTWYFPYWKEASPGGCR